MGVRRHVKAHGRGAHTSNAKLRGAFGARQRHSATATALLVAATTPPSQRARSRSSAAVAGASLPAVPPLAAPRRRVTAPGSGGDAAAAGRDTAICRGNGSAAGYVVRLTWHVVPAPRAV
jgi:hypothetical protein